MTVNFTRQRTDGSLKTALKMLNRRFWLSFITSPESLVSTTAIYLSSELENQKWQKCLAEGRVPNANSIFTYTNSRELKALYEIANQCPKASIALEIGSHLGASSCYIAAGLKQNGGHLFCVDTWENETMPEGKQDTFLEFQKNTTGVKQQITPIRKRSEDVNDTDFKAPLNLVFIDGDHSYEVTKQDFECVQQWIAEDGIIAFHDFSSENFEGVTRVVGEALASGKWILVGKVDSLAWIKPAKWTTPPWL